MSVTIVSTLRVPTPAGAAGAAGAAEKAAGVAAGGLSGSGDALAGLDFASVLLGQLTPTLAQALRESALQTDLPASDAAPADAVAADVAPADAAALLAGLGIVPPAQRRDPDLAPATETAMPSTSTPGSPRADSVLVLPTAVAAGQSLASDEKAGPVKLESALNQTLAADEKPANFAAALATASIVDNAAAPTVAPDPTPDTLAAIANSLPGKANDVVPKRETSLSVPTSIHNQDWASDFGQKIVWLASNDRQAAQITLNPAQMGPIEISLNLEKGHATASFVSASADVREAIETALPRLREMFASAGIELGQTNVSAESFRQQAGSGNGYSGASQSSSDNAILVAGSGAALPARAFAGRHGSGLVDTFA
jgi:flagellar hook-length control protein FliK